MNDATSATNAALAQAPAPVKARGRLFRKYVAFFVAAIALALLLNGASEVWFSYQEHKTALIRIQHEQAEAAAAKIGQFIREIESQIGWTTQLPWTAGALEQRRFDALRLLRQVPAITELAQLDAAGREQLRVSRLAMDVVGSGTDYSKDPKFTEAVANKIYYGPVYFRRESEPYMTLAMAGARRDAGVSVAEVNLKFIWDVVSQIKVGEHGQAYVIDAQSRLIAYPDISQVLRNTDMSRLAQVQAARAGASGLAPDDVQVAQDLRGRPVLTAYAPVPPLNWLVFVELPRAEAYAPLYGSIKRSGTLLLAALAFAIVAGLALARRMVGPIQALRTGAARIGGGDLSQRISIKTGDELEGLADQFNDMAGRLQESYADLETKVEVRTKELSESLQQQTATANVLKTISRSTFDLKTVLNTLVESAARLCEADQAVIGRPKGATYYFEASYGVSPEFAEFLVNHPAQIDGSSISGRVLFERRIVHVPDVLADPEYRYEARTIGGFRTLLGVPILREGAPIGVITLARNSVRAFTDRQIELVVTFADQAGIAIENVRLFDEIQDKSRQLAEASQHKSQFLANMSHELRTPLNAILGYTELILDNIYGDAPQKMRAVLERVQSNGKHLLGLINDVLDLSKIEAGQLTLSLHDYSIKDMIQGVYVAVEPLASSKNLALKVDIAPDLPPGHGDERRLAQVLLNLVGNAIKFTDQGEVAIKVTAADGSYTVAVQDTGPGISPADQAKLFREFQQGDNTVTRKKGGTGLGLAISKRIVEMHGGRIWVDSVVDQGSTFSFTVPIRVVRQADGT